MKFEDITEECVELQAQATGKYKNSTSNYIHVIAYNFFEILNIRRFFRKVFFSLIVNHHLSF